MSKSISPATAVVAILVVVIVVAIIGFLVTKKGSDDSPGGGVEPDVLDEGGTPMLNQSPATSGGGQPGMAEGM